VTFLTELPLTQVIVDFLAVDTDWVGVGVGVGAEANTYLNAASTTSLFAPGNPCVVLHSI
jgi:hypothetical protein